MAIEVWTFLNSILISEAGGEQGVQVWVRRLL